MYASYALFCISFSFFPSNVSASIACFLADGIVCSPQEIEMIKKELGNDFITLTPGVRPVWAAAGDQKRVMTPKEAVDKGTDYIVVGRPITGAENRKEAAEKIS